MKSGKLAIGITLLFACSASVAHAGREGGNGGGDEIFFHSLASQIDGWLQKYWGDGTLAAKLDLDSTQISAKDLVDAYEGALQGTPDVKFIPQNQLENVCKTGDLGACLLLDNPTRICVNHGKESQNSDDVSYIRCNSNLFDIANGDIQFSIVFHEYLGVAGIEKNGSSDIASYSQYPISKHLLQYAAPKSVIRYELGGEKVGTSAFDRGDAVPDLPNMTLAIWDAIKNRKLLVPQSLETAITSRSSQGLFEMKVKTQLLHGGESGQKKPDSISLARSGDFLALWIAVDFDPAHPGELAYAKLDSALWAEEGNQGPVSYKMRLLDAGMRIKLAGDEPTRLSKFEIGSLDFQGYVDITQGGGMQLYLRLAGSLGATAESIRDIDLNDDSAALGLGEIGVRFAKAVTLRGRAQVKGFGLGAGGNGSDPTQLSGIASGYGGTVEWQPDHHVKVYGRLDWIDTAGLKNNEGETSATSATGGLLIDFW